MTGYLRNTFPTFPPRFRVTLPYYESGLQLQTGAGLASNYFFSANGCYDPNVTGTGHQPMGFDQLMLWFEQYTVVASRCRIRCYQTSTSAVVISALSLSPDTTNITDPIRLVENGLIQTKLHSTFSGTDKFVTEHELGCDVARYFGRNQDAKELVTDVTLSGGVAANPTEQVYFAVSCWDSQLTAIVGVYIEVFIYYDVILWEPRKLTVS